MTMSERGATSVQAFIYPHSLPEALPSISIGPSPLSIRE